MGTGAEGFIKKQVETIPREIILRQHHVDSMTANHAFRREEVKMFTE